jgi:hypothetical protein
MNSRNCKRLRECEEIEISRQSCREVTVNSKEENSKLLSGFRPRIRPLNLFYSPELILHLPKGVLELLHEERLLRRGLVHVPKHVERHVSTCSNGPRTTLIKKKIKFSSYIRKFRGIGREVKYD